jgi:hypothetical protein
MTTMKTTYTAIIDGQTFTRTTERTYTHCVVARVVNRYDFSTHGIAAVEGDALGVLGFCGSLALAQKLAAKEASFRFTTAADEAKHRPRAGKRFPTGTGSLRYADVQVVPVAPVVKGA